jgi:demethylmenaquinone methyltransferase/2-methoxy-6-polyprenyl-1,4-benzoquinol methylase
MTSRHGPGDITFFDRFARLYDPLMPASSAKDFADAFAFADRPVRRVLDLAGGTGRVADALDAVGYEAIVADLSKPMLGEARDRGLETVQGDASTLPFPDDSFDAVVIVDAYHHLPAQADALAEAARIVAPDGVVVIRDFDPTTVVGRLIEVAELLFGMGSQFADADEAAAALSGAGLHSRVLGRGTTYTVAGRRPSE